MLQALLADRFGLVLHQGQNKPVNAFVLSAGKGSPKMKSLETRDRGRPDATDSRAGRPRRARFRASPYSCRNTTMDVFAETTIKWRGLSDALGINETKLQGSWDFDLSWTPRGALAQAGSDRRVRVRRRRAAAGTEARREENADCR